MNPPPFSQLLERITVTWTGCWLWVRNWTNGYARIYWRGKEVLGHRLFYQQLKGEIADGLSLDHLCRNRGCVNPAHLEPVTQRENLLRGASHQKTHCPQGHKYSDKNTYVSINRHGNQTRHCHTCMTARNRAQKGVRKRVRA